MTSPGATTSQFLSAAARSADVAATPGAVPIAASSDGSPDAPPADGIDELGVLDGGTIRVRLPEVIRVCVLSDPKILAALESIEQAQADHTTARLVPNPTLRSSMTLIAFPGSPFNAKTKQGGPPQLDIGLIYSLDTLIFGIRKSDMKATRLGVDVAFAQYADVARRRILDAIKTYYDVLEAREILRITDQDIHQLERFRDITERRVELGSVGQVELDRIRVAVASGRTRLLRAEADLDNARSRLRARLGRARGAERADAEGTLEFDSPPPPPSLQVAMEAAEKHRPDLLALDRTSVRARADLQRERRRAAPKLSIAAGYTRQFQRRSIGFPDANSWGVGLEVSLPFSDRNQGNIARARSAVRRADLLASAARLDLRAEIEQAIRDYEVAYELVTTLDEEALAPASSARERVEEAYALGGRTLLEVLDAQAAFREVVRARVVAHADLLRALHRVNAVVGKAILR